MHAAERSAQRHGRANRRLRALLAAAAVLLVSALVAGLVAARQAGTARESAEVADAQRAGARALASQNLAESLLLAVEGVRLANTRQTRANLFAAVTKHPELVRSWQLHAGQLVGLDVGHGGRSVQLLDLLGGVTSLDRQTGEVLAHRRGGGGPTPFDGKPAVAVSRDGALVAAGRPAFQDQPVVLLDVDTLAPVSAQPGDSRESDPDRRRGLQQGRLDPGRQRPPVPWHARGQRADGLVGPGLGPRGPATAGTPYPDEHPSPASAVALSADGSRVYTSMPLAAYDVASGERLFGAPSHVSYELELSPAGRTLALADVGRDTHLAGTDILLVDARTGTVSSGWPYTPTR